MVERDHVRRAFVLEKGFIDQRHLRRGDQIDAQLRLCDFQLRKQPAHDLLEQSRVDFLRSLTVGDDDVHFKLLQPT